MRTNTRAATLTTIHTSKKGWVSCDQALAELLERLDRMLQAERAGGGDADAAIEFILCLSLFDDPGREGAVADLRRRSGARTFAELVAFMRTSHLNQAEVDDLGDDVHRRASSFDEADLAKVFKCPLGQRRRSRERGGRRRFAAPRGR